MKSNCIVCYIMTCSHWMVAFSPTDDLESAMWGILSICSQSPKSHKVSLIEFTRPLVKRKGLPFSHRATRER